MNVDIYFMVIMFDVAFLFDLRVLCVELCLSLPSSSNWKLHLPSNLHTR
jgi:hypothetical protein